VLLAAEQAASSRRLVRLELTGIVGLGWAAIRPVRWLR
jgi:hypothetical protein